MFSLERGFSAETSGGLLLCLPRDNAEAFCKEIEEADGCAAWVIGEKLISLRVHLTIFQEMWLKEITQPLYILLLL